MINPSGAVVCSGVMVKTIHDHNFKATMLYFNNNTGVGFEVHHRNFNEPVKYDYTVERMLKRDGWKLSKDAPPTMSNAYGMPHRNWNDTTGDRILYACSGGPGIIEAIYVKDDNRVSVFYGTYGSAPSHMTTNNKDAVPVDVNAYFDRMEIDKMNEMRALLNEEMEKRECQNQRF